MIVKMTLSSQLPEPKMINEITAFIHDEGRSFTCRIPLTQALLDSTYPDKITYWEADFSNEGLKLLYRTKDEQKYF